MAFEDYPLAECGYDSFEKYRIVGWIGDYPVYSYGIQERREDALIGFWFDLPSLDKIWDSIVQRREGDNSSFTWTCPHGHNWMSIEVNTWGATNVTGIEEDGSVDVRLGTHGGYPLFIELICHTGNDFPRYSDISELVEPLYRILLEVLQASSPTELMPHEQMGWK